MVRRYKNWHNLLDMEQCEKEMMVAI